MKITIELNAAEVAGIKDYLREVGDVEKPGKEDIKQFIDSIVQSIHAPQESVSHYIKQRENESIL